MTEEPPRLIQLAIEHGATNPPGLHFYHGETHWKGVALVGLEIARKTAGVDVEALLTFAMLHDICRLNESNPGEEDPLHGHRAAQLFVTLVEGGHMEAFEPYSERTLTTFRAIKGHARARTSSDPTIGACWDADRLTLWRVGIEPRDEFLSTETGRRSATRVLGWEMARRQLAREEFPTWQEINKEMQTWRL